MDIPLEDFCTGLEVELAQGTQFKEANVTNNQSMDYYKRLEVAEIEGDILKALVAKNWPRWKLSIKSWLKRNWLFTRRNQGN